MEFEKFNEKYNRNHQFSGIAESSERIDKETDRLSICVSELVKGFIKDMQSAGIYVEGIEEDSRKNGTMYVYFTAGKLHSAKRFKMDG